MILFAVSEEKVFCKQNKAAFKTEFFSETDTKELSCGIKFSSKDFNAVLGLRDFNLEETRFHTDKKNLNAAVQIGSVFYLGNLSFSDSISRLKNPLLYVSSPLKNSIYLTPGIKCSLPQYNGSPKPLSAAIVFSNIEFAAIEENEFFFNLHKSIPSIGKKSSINLTCGIFRHKKDFKSAWFNEYKFYKEAGFLCGSAEFNMHSKYFETSIVTGASENPFGGFFYYATSQNSLILNCFRLNFSLYQGDEDLITASGTHTKTKRQIEINPQFIRKVKNGVFKTGILFHCKFKTGKNEYTSKAGINLQTTAFSLTAAGFCSFKTEDQFFEYGANLSFLKKTKFTSWNTKFSYKNEKIIKNTYSLSGTLNLNLSLRPEFSASITAIEKQGEMKYKFYTSASVQKKTQNLTANFRITYDFVAIP